jgi:NAD+ synthase
MENINYTIEPGSQIDASAACSAIKVFIQTSLERMQRDGAVIALSGGLDSAIAATLTVRSLGADRVHLLNMPERDSKPIHRHHARLLAAHLGVPIIVKNITPILKATGTYRMLPLRFIPGRSMRTAVVNFAKSYFKIDTRNILANRFNPGARTLVAKGAAYALAKHRIRMVMVYQYAEVHNLMVVGSANRTEWLTGTFSKWGVDHCADVMPLLHLYRSQLEQIAEYLDVPDAIRSKAADPDILPGINDKSALLGNFFQADHILYALEQGTDKQELYQIYDQDNVDQIMNLWQLSKHMRESPYQLS